MKRVCMYMNSWTFGGVEEHAAVLASQLPAEGYDPLVVCSGSEALWPLHQRLLAARVRHIETDRVGSIAALVQLLRECHVDLLHLQLCHWDGGRRALIAAKIARVPIVVTHHGAPSAPAAPILRRGLMYFADRFIAVSDANRVAQIEHLKLRPKKVSTVHNGIVLGETPDRRAARQALCMDLGIDPRTKLVAFVGRLSPEKQPHLLVEAMAKLPEAHLVIVGDGPLRGEVAALAARRGVCAHFLGFRDDVRQLLAGVDVLAMPSARESFGIVLVEALAAGTPIVAFAVGGVPEVVSHGIDGYLVSPGHVAGMTDRLRAVLNEPAAMSEAARHSAARFSAEAMTQATAAVYGQALT